MSDPAQDERDRRGEFRAFWTTLPGVLTGVAAVLTAVVALLTLWGGGDDADTAPAPASTAAERSTPGDAESGGGDSGGGSATDTPAARATPPSSADVLAQGELTMRTPEDADLERGLVGASVDGADLYLFCDAGTCLLTNMGSGQLLTTAPGPVDRAGCVSALRMRQDGALRLSQVPPGWWLCLQTSEGHIAAVEPTHLPDVGAVELSLRYTVWR
jgi:hypothetical protein